ncbi:MAG: hypothetical protein MK095_10845, partial [Phycisphaerales bacterium]|nr:hypothetical protein [Phycisphaerales bacterium]
MQATNQLQFLKAVAKRPKAALVRAYLEMRPSYRGKGYCPICEKEVNFKALRSWLRDYLFCSNCRSIPRERALMQVIKDWYPNWKQASVHESSPEDRGASVRLSKECREYCASQYDPATPWGELDTTGAWRSEDLENQTFP